MLFKFSINFIRWVTRTTYRQVQRRNYRAIGFKIEALRNRNIELKIRALFIRALYSW